MGNIKKSLLIIFFPLAGWWVHRSVQANRAVSDKEYAAEVFRHYMRYACLCGGACDQKKALEKMKYEWKKSYQLGFYILEAKE